jgi:hypothetical protein
MKKYYVPLLLVLTSVIFSYCHGSKKATASAPKLTYQNNIQTLIAANCSPCHIPAKGGNKKPFDTYAAAQENIDAMIARIELNPTDKGFMPFKKPKLSDSTIAVFKQWKTDGLVQ